MKTYQQLVIGGELTPAPEYTLAPAQRRALAESPGRLDAEARHEAEWAANKCPGCGHMYWCCVCPDQAG